MTSFIERLTAKFDAKFPTALLCPRKKSSDTTVFGFFYITIPLQLVISNGLTTAGTVNFRSQLSSCSSCAITSPQYSAKVK